ncbi:alanine--tRNA ligase [Candidatus Izimaplasma bacterium ZiA1]|uniref:alanine--tRNA ligase n=1 Tax=Candidatus Izimoplasma sp. ZiA1 TaxID=2024899 RepID=UPI000BAA3C95|nr:alanine--tRNA ligase [Candidatus Izimaplasma bacterium ZiA1]
MKKLKGYEIRQMWLDFFKEKGHDVEESASLIPNNDPTLLWIGAGVAPLKQYFDGSRIPKNPRITNAQKCIRTNDIENVGVTARHHTFFEMLGNFSIGDYFRDEIIPWAYELLFSEKWFNFDQELIYITVYDKDIETYNKWVEVGIKESHLVMADHNFWEIGSGPCGPDTEIFFDRGSEYGEFDLNLMKEDIENERFIEIWNIVFSQFNSDPLLKRSEYKELPSKNIDTGMGLERMACVMQGTKTNFETDFFMPLINKVEEISGVKYNGQMSFKVIVDHLRTVTFAISDGAVLSNEGRGYVLRRLLRRAIKHGKQLGIKGTFLSDLVDTVIDNMSNYYTYLNEYKDLVKKIISIEENKFLETLTQGEKMLEEIIESSDDKMIKGVDAFTLYDTYGFPVELTVEIAETHDFKVDQDGFKQEMEKQKERARGARKSTASMKEQNEEYINFKQESTFVGYDKLSVNTTIIKSFPEGVILDETPFYAESGGQVADKGIIIYNGVNYQVQDVQKLPNGQFIHFLDEHPLKDLDEVTAVVDEESRNLTMYNHSATHLLFKVLRDIVGTHVSQQGSLVSKDYLRFDFNNYDNLTDEDLLEIESKVNELINKNIAVKITEKTIDEAKAMGAIAEFGEKYDHLVRVVDMNETIDLCGGTHVTNTGDIKKFAIASIESKGSGIYRILGHANEAVINIENQLKGFNDEIEKLHHKLSRLAKEAQDNNLNIKTPVRTEAELTYSYQDIINKRHTFKEIGEIIRNYEKEIKEALKTNVFKDLDQYLVNQENGRVVLELNDFDKDLLKPLADRLLEKVQTGFIFIANKKDDKVTFIAKTNIKTLHAGNVCKAAALITKGNGGGRPDMAQAGGKDITFLDEAINKVKELIS